jgi:brefeldin A-resistance guanine nucleotide exchange factor 1
MLYTLELATVLALRDRKTIETIGENLAGSLQAIIRDARNIHPIITSRVIHYLLNLLRLSYVSFLFKTIIFNQLTLPRSNHLCVFP